MASTTIDATVPAAEIQRYATDLRSITQGRGSFTSDFRITSQFRRISPTRSWRRRGFERQWLLEPNQTLEKATGSGSRIPALHPRYPYIVFDGGADPNPGKGYGSYLLVSPTGAGARGTARLFEAEPR